MTPAPWINVISNPAFGFQVSESGSGYTWSANSRENQLTPWSNDPVVDPPGEAIYVRDEESGEFWTPTALPIREAGQPYMARHGQGYSRFEHASHGISLELLQFVPLERSDQGVPPDGAERFGPAAAIVRDRVCRVGARGVSKRFRAVHRDRDRRGDEGDDGPQHVGQRLRRPGGVCRSRRVADGVDRRPDGVPGTERRSRVAPRPSSARAASPDESAPASTRAVRSRPSSSFARESASTSCSSSARRPHARRRAR